MAQRVTIFGGSGFIGRYITKQFAQAGWRVQVATRSPNEAVFVRPYGVVGQVEPIFCNIRDDQTVAAAVKNADLVINCVGLLAPTGKNTFSSIHVDGAERIARLSAEAGVSHMVHISAIGADHEALSEYARTKAAGEDAVLAHMPNASILRPSIVFGPEDDFFNRFAPMSSFSPILGIMGAESRFQPIYVDDLAKATFNAGTMQKAGVFEIGGPQTYTFRALMGVMLDTIQRRRIVANIPFGLGHIMAKGFKLGQTLSFGLVKAPVTQDQLYNLAHDNVVSSDAKTLQDLEVEATPLEAVLPQYLWRFRPSGQYADIKTSAANLKKSDM